MYPCFMWWNPIIYLPWSGPVYQDISTTWKARIEAIEFRQAQLIRLAYKEHIGRLNLLQPGHQTDEHVNEIRTLLKLMHSLDPDEYARIVKEDAGTKPSGG